MALLVERNTAFIGEGGVLGMDCELMVIKLKQKPLLARYGTLSLIFRNLVHI